MKAGLQLTKFPGTGFDRFCAWSRHGEHFRESHLERLEEKWETMRSRTGSVQVLVRILDLRFGITGRAHTVRDTARLLKMPEGTISGKIFEAASVLVNSTPTPKVREIPYIMPEDAAPAPFEQTFPKKEPPPVTFAQTFRHRLEGRQRGPSEAWNGLPNWQKERVYRALLRERERQLAEGENAEAWHLHEEAADGWRAADACLDALRALGFDVNVLP